MAHALHCIRGMNTQTNTTEHTMDTIIERFESLLKTGEAADQTAACHILMREGVPMGKAALAARRAFGGKGAVRRIDSSITQRSY